MYEWPGISYYDINTKHWFQVFLGFPTFLDIIKIGNIVLLIRKSTLSSNFPFISSLQNLKRASNQEVLVLGTLNFNQNGFILGINWHFITHSFYWLTTVSCRPTHLALGDKYHSFLIALLELGLWPRLFKVGRYMVSFSKSAWFEKFQQASTKSFLKRRFEEVWHLVLMSVWLKIFKPDMSLV